MPGGLCVSQSAAGGDSGPGGRDPEPDRARDAGGVVRAVTPGILSRTAAGPYHGVLELSWIGTVSTSARDRIIGSVVARYFRKWGDSRCALYAASSA